MSENEGLRMSEWDRWRSWSMMQVRARAGGGDGGSPHGNPRLKHAGDTSHGHVWLNAHPECSHNPGFHILRLDTSDMLWYMFHSECEHSSHSMHLP
jgi:hypothetical protein